MNHTNKTSQSGFSLVELMVVVAIIGILASIAIPSVNKYMAKSRQSEAKVGLAAIYTAEKAFFTEYNTYDRRLAAIGYTPEGQYRYNIGFNSGGVVAGPANGYTITPANANYSTKTQCGSGGTFTNGCTVLNGASGSAPADLGATYVTAASTFLAGATAVVVSGSTDAWSMSENKELKNQTNGIP